MKKTILFIKNHWGYILLGLFLILCWFYIGLAIMWIGFYLLFVFGGLTLFTNRAADKFTQNFTQGRVAGSRLLRWFLFPAAAMTGVALILLGGYFVWEERPEYFHDRVLLSQAEEEHPNVFSFWNFNDVWEELENLSGTLDKFSEKSLLDTVAGQAGPLHSDLAEKYKTDDDFRSTVTSALSQIPHHPGRKNIYYYMKNFPQYGPIEIAAGEYRLVLNAHTYLGEFNGQQVTRVSWKLSDITPNSGDRLPDISSCFFKVICLGIK